MSATMKKCYYEVLEVERSVDDDQLKRAYRRLVLRWHPDKNPDNTEESTRQFRLIQEAYEILSNSQERAWYDGHRESILNPGGYWGGSGGRSGGGSGGKSDGNKYSNGTGYFEIIDVMAYFNTTVFTGFDDDDPKSFYSVYRNLFDRLRKQEEDAIKSYQYSSSRESTESDDEDEMMRKAKDGRILYTTFGDSQVDYRTLRDFYGFWLNFATRLSFSWCDQYRLSEAPNRRVRRLMQKENEKLRETGRKEYNESVRQLTQFVQRRDQRWTKLQEEAKMANETRVAIQARRLAEERAARAAQMMSYEEQEWMKVDDEAIEASLEGRRLGDPWKSNDNDEEALVDNDAEDEYNSEAEYLEEFYCAACEKAFKSEKQFQNHEKSKKHIKRVSELRKHMLLEEEEFEDARSEFSGDSEPKVGQFEKAKGEDEIINETNLEGITEKFQQLNSNAQGKHHHVFESDSDQSLNDGEKSDEDEDVNDSENKPSKNAEPQRHQQTKKTRRAAKKKGQQEQQVVLKCNVCGEEYPSRNKLFRHINETNHAQNTTLSADISDNEPYNNKKTKKKSSKRK